jgi:hypothetical protein
MMKIQMATFTNSSMKPTATKAPLDGATSSEADSHQHGNKQLHATTMRDNWDISTTQYCGQEKSLTKCGLCSKPFGYTAMVNYMEKTMRSSDLLPSEQYVTQYKLSVMQLKTQTTLNSQQHSTCNFHRGLEVEETSPTCSPSNSQSVPGTKH